MTLIFPGGPPQVMTRIGAAHRDAHPIIGDWTYMYPAGVQAVQRFSRKGLTQLSVAAMTLKGPYRIEDETMHIQFDGMPAVALTVKREGEVLTTRDDKGKETRFIKFEY